MEKLELKIPPVGVFLLFVLAMWLTAKITPAYPFNATFRGLVISLALAVGAVYGLGGVAAFRRAGTTVNPLDPGSSSSLVTGGIFRLSRNPMYVALLFTLAAWGLFLANFYALAIATLFVPWMNRFQIGPEERAMERLFGDEFERYKKTTRRWL